MNTCISKSENLSCELMKLSLSSTDPQLQNLLNFDYRGTLKFNILYAFHMSWSKLALQYAASF